MTTIQEAFARAKSQGRAAFIPYVTGGHPDMATCARLIKALDKSGADIIEIGVPFSDPVADGPVIQTAGKIALDGGTTPAGIIELAAGLRDKVSAPLVLMTYYNPMLAMGLDSFAAKSAQAGVAGVIVPDLPPEEAGPWLRAARGHGLDTIFLVTPGTSQERLQTVLQACSGFLYYVSMYGVTGSALRMDAKSLAAVERVRQAARGLPVAVGFGVAAPEQAAALANVADGVIVGSALVKRMLEVESAEQGLAAASELALSLSRSLAA